MRKIALDSKTKEISLGLDKAQGLKNGKNEKARSKLEKERKQLRAKSLGLGKA